MIVLLLVRYELPKLMLMDDAQCQAIVVLAGILNYVTVVIKDIVFLMRLVWQFMVSPCIIHWVLMYIKGAQSRGLCTNEGCTRVIRLRLSGILTPAV